MNNESIAKIIMNGKKTISTMYGKKTEKGITDLITRGNKEEENLILDLIREFSHGPRQKNPYARDCVKKALKHLAKKHNLSDWIDSASILDKRRENENG
jgi:hypothetical protein